MMKDEFKEDSKSVSNPLDKFFTDDDEGLDVKGSNEDYLNKMNPPKWKEIKRSRKNSNKNSKYRDEIDSTKWKDVEKVKKKSKLNPSNKIIFIAILVLFICLLISFTYLFSMKCEIFSKGSIGVEAVDYLYNFSSIKELEDNLDGLKEIVTEDVYKKVAVTNSDKALNTYLKFKKNPVSVVVIESKPGFVLYTLESSSLSSGRKFIFSYTVDWKGKINSVRELEGIDFYK